MLYSLRTKEINFTILEGIRFDCMYESRRRAIESQMGCVARICDSFR